MWHWHMQPLGDNLLINYAAQLESHFPSNHFFKCPLRMDFRQSKQALGPTQQSQTSTAGLLERQHLAALLPAKRASLFQQFLVQQTPIHILANGSFCKLEEPLVSSIQLISPLQEADSLSIEAAQTFYSCNEFVISVSTIPKFVAWNVGNSYRPSNIIARLVAFYGSPFDSNEGDSEIMPLLSMPALRNLRLVFQDYKFKGPGPNIRPSLKTIMLLKARPNLHLTLQVRKAGQGLFSEEAYVQDIDMELEDITVYLQPPAIEEEKAVMESRAIIQRYKGGASYHVTILMESGWSWEYSEKVVHELSCRVQLGSGWNKIGWRC
jgi:hypothetical protein